MGYIFDGLSRRITLTAGTSQFSTNDLYSRWKDWVIAGNARWLAAFSTSGGEAIGQGQTAGFYLFLDNGWSIVPASVSELTIFGNLLRFPGDISNVPIFQGIVGNIKIIQQTSSVAIGYSTGGGSGGLSNTQDARLTQIHSASAKVDGLIELTVTGNRFTAKALETVAVDASAIATTVNSAMAFRFVPLLELYKRQGMVTGVTVTQKNPAEGVPGFLRTSDNTIDQTITINAGELSIQKAV